MSNITIVSRSSWESSKVLYEGDFPTKKACVEAAVEAGVNLEYAKLDEFWFKGAEPSAGPLDSTGLQGKFPGKGLLYQAMSEPVATCSSVRFFNQPGFQCLFQQPQ